jgi:hypothetical protein
MAELLELEVRKLYGLIRPAQNLQPRYAIAHTTATDVLPMADGISLVPMRQNWSARRSRCAPAARQVFGAYA